MKVSKLIKKLEKLNPNDEIVCTDEFSEDVFEIASVGPTYIRVRAVWNTDEHDDEE